MKKFNSSLSFACSIIFMFLILNSFAQIKEELNNGDGQKDNDHIKFNLNIYSGINFTAFSGKTDEFAGIVGLRKKWRSFTFPLGISFLYNIKPWLSISTGILYIEKGIKFTGSTYVPGAGYGGNLPSPGTDIRHVLKFQLHYFEIPTGFRIITAKNWNSKKPHLYIDIGVAPSFLFYSKLAAKSVAIDNATWTASEPEKSSSKIDDFYRFDLGIVIGGGLKVANFYTGLQFESGFFEMPKVTYWNFKNQVISVIIGGYINLKSKKKINN